MTDGPAGTPPIPPAGRGRRFAAAPHADRMSAESSSLRYSSSVLAPAQLALGVVGGLVVAFILVALGLWPVSIVALIAAVALGWYLAPLTVTIGGRHLAISEGRGDRNERVVNTDDITAVEARTLTWQQCLGIGIESDDLTTRMTVRPGPTLFVSLISGEQLRLSAQDPEQAVAALGHAVPLVPTSPVSAVAPPPLLPDGAGVPAVPPVAVDPPPTDPPVAVDPPPTDPPLPVTPPTQPDDAAPVVPSAPAEPAARPRPRPRPQA